MYLFFFFQAEDGIRDAQESRGLGDVYKRQVWLNCQDGGRHIYLAVLHYVEQCFLEEPVDDDRRAQRQGLRASRPGPVSYTHLRAHETPEHLVCRLLLDKKKPYQ